MLVKINVNPDGVTYGYRRRHINFMRAVGAVATAPAGSTPSVHPFNGTISDYATTAVDSTKDCIVDVIANTEAGGWEANSYDYNVMNSNPNWAHYYAQLGLYKPSGKSQYPYYKILISDDSDNLNSSFGSTSGVTAQNDTLYRVAARIRAGVAENESQLNNRTSFASRVDTGNVNGTSYNSHYTHVVTYLTNGKRSIDQDFNLMKGQNVGNYDPRSDEYWIACTADYFCIIGHDGIFYFGLT